MLKAEDVWPLGAVAVGSRESIHVSFAPQCSLQTIDHCGSIAALRSAHLEDGETSLDGALQKRSVPGDHVRDREIKMLSQNMCRI